MKTTETLDQFKLWLPGAVSSSRPAVASKPILSTLRAWIDLAHGPVADDAVWPRLSNYPYGPAPR